MEPLFARNGPLDVNLPGGASHLSNGGSYWLYAVTAIFIIATVVFFILSFRPHNGERSFHYLFTIAFLTGTVAYYAMASDLAFSVIAQHLHVGRAATYQVFFAKYIFWVVSFPIIIIALGLISGASWVTVLFNVLLSWIWIVSYLCSAYTTTRYKWGFYTFGTIAYILLAVQTLWRGHTSATHFNVVKRQHAMLSGYVNFLWFLYPIAFAVSDGGNVIGVTGSLIFFGILDLFLLLGTAIAFNMFSHQYDYDHMNLRLPHQYGLNDHEAGHHKLQSAGGTTADHHAGTTDQHAGTAPTMDRPEPGYRTHLHHTN